MRAKRQLDSERKLGFPCLVSGTSERRPPDYSLRRFQMQEVLFTKPRCESSCSRKPLSGLFSNICKTQIQVICVKYFKVNLGTILSNLIARNQVGWKADFLCNIKNVTILNFSVYIKRLNTLYYLFVRLF